MNQTEFSKKFSELIRDFRTGEFQEGEFIERLRSLADQHNMSDEELNWVKQWNQEIDKYGLEEVINAKFDFPEDLDESDSGDETR